MHHVLLSSLLRIRGLYSQPVLRSGIQRRFPAFSDGLRSQPYWCPTTVPTNQLFDVALQMYMSKYIFRKLLDIVKFYSNNKKNQRLPVIDEVFSSVLLVHWSVIVVIHHPVHTQYIRLVMLYRTLRLQYNSWPPWVNCNSVSRYKNARLNLKKFVSKNLRNAEYISMMRVQRFSLSVSISAPVILNWFTRCFGCEVNILHWLIWCSTCTTAERSSLSW